MEIFDSNLAQEGLAGFETCAPDATGIRNVRRARQKTPYAIALLKGGGAKNL
jgi:hypothetical protein